MITDLFQSCGHCWVFQMCWHIECSTFTASSFRILNSSSGISSPPLALFVAVLPKAHLTSLSRMFGSRWVIIAWRSFCIVLHDPDNHDGVITHLEPDILECKFKWALGSITTNKARGGGGIPVEVFQILKHYAVKVLQSICQHIWKTQQWPQYWKRSVFIPFPNKGNAEEFSDYHTTALISHASKVMHKILQTRLQQNMNRELPDVQAGFRKGRGTRDQIANICWIIE